MLRALRRLTSPSAENEVEIEVPRTSKIDAWRRQMLDGDELRVVFGGHWSDNPGWLILDEADQDITGRLDFDDESVDAIFSEHILEHVDFVGGVNFLRESFRILKPGGTFRVVCPMLDKLMRAEFGDPRGTAYTKNSLVPHFSREDDLLLGLGLGGLSLDPFVFFMNSMFREHGHKFIWSTKLLIEVMGRLGYVGPSEMGVGQGSIPAYCLERRRRGIYLGNDWREEMNSQDSYDIESGVVEARKPGSS